MTDFLHTLERYRAGAVWWGLSCNMSSVGTGNACPKGWPLQAWKPRSFSPWAIFLGAKALQIWRQQSGNGYLL